MYNHLQDKNILLGITGGIAAYKIPGLVRQLKKLGANVKVVMTASATEFVTPLTLQTVSQEKVHCSMFDLADEFDIDHISLAKWADVLLIAPATANILAKMANGIADDLLSTIHLATAAPVMVALAMNQAMWQHQATQHNIATLQKRNVLFVGPETGFQACGDEGIGRMSSLNTITDVLLALFTPKTLSEKSILITAGPTREHLDPVRFLSNPSSGKMGIALANAAANAGAQVTLICGPTHLTAQKNVQTISVTSAQEMHEVVMQKIKEQDIFISTAAVSDYRPKQIAKQKIKKSNEKITIDFIKNPDILHAVSQLKNRPLLIGFSAETENIEKNALKKLKAKNLDLIVANKVGPTEGFNQNDIEATLIDKNGNTQILPKQSKTALAQAIMLSVARME